RGKTVRPQLQAKRWILTFGNPHHGCCGLSRVSGLWVVRVIRPLSGCASRLAVIADNVSGALQRRSVQEIDTERPRFDDGDFDAERFGFGLHGFAEAFDHELGRAVNTPTRPRNKTTH